MEPVELVDIDLFQGVATLLASEPRIMLMRVFLVLLGCHIQKLFKGKLRLDHRGQQDVGIVFGRNPGIGNSLTTADLDRQADPGGHGDNLGAQNLTE